MFLICPPYFHFASEEHLQVLAWIKVKNSPATGEVRVKQVLFSGLASQGPVHYSLPEIRRRCQLTLAVPSEVSEDPASRLLSLAELRHITKQLAGIQEGGAFKLG